MADFYRELGDAFGVPLKVHFRWSSFKDLRARWEAHLATTLCRPVLIIDEAQEMDPDVLSELRSLSSSHFDSRSILTVVLSGDLRLLDLLRLPQLIPRWVHASAPGLPSNMPLLISLASCSLTYLPKPAIRAC